MTPAQFCWFLRTEAAVDFLLQSPSALQGAYDQSADMWAVGVILYMLLSGQPPFQGALDEEVLEQVRFTEAELTGETWDAISPAAKVGTLGWGWGGGGKTGQAFNGCGSSWVQGGGG